MRTNPWRPEPLTTPLPDCELSEECGGNRYCIWCDGYGDTAQGKICSWCQRDQPCAFSWGCGQRLGGSQHSSPPGSTWRDGLISFCKRGHIGVLREQQPLIAFANRDVASGKEYKADNPNFTCEQIVWEHGGEVEQIWSKESVVVNNG